MKEKILFLIIGFLVGAILTTGVFLIFGKNQDTEMQGERFDKSQMNGNMAGGAGRGGNMTLPDGELPTDVDSSSTSTSTNSL